MRIPFYQDRLESPLKQMSNPLVPPVETLSVNAVELAHADRKVRLGRLHQQVIMIGHQAVGAADPVVAIHHPGQCAQKQLAVGVSKKTLSAARCRGSSDDRSHRETLIAEGAP